MESYGNLQINQGKFIIHVYIIGNSDGKKFVSDLFYKRKLI